MRMLKPYSTLAIGIALGLFVVPAVTRKLGVSVPGV
jgi:hypothetical protein